MSADSIDSLLLLEDARRGAQRALETLLHQQQALISGGQHADGLRAVERAIEAARHTLRQIDADVRAASTSAPTDPA